MAYLTFDWDDVVIEDPIVIQALDELNSRFGYGTIWYRVSSSQKGIHVVVARLDFNNDQGIMELKPDVYTNDEQEKIRHEFAEKPWYLECKGRLISDSVRNKNGFRTGRLFWAKNNELAKGWELYE